MYLLHIISEGVPVPRTRIRGAMKPRCVYCQIPHTNNHVHILSNYYYSLIPWASKLQERLTLMECSIARQLSGNACSFNILGIDLRILFLLSAEVKT